MGNNGAPVRLRPATLADCRPLWEWRNEPGTREASFQSAPVSFEDHRRWFGTRLRDPNTVIFVVVAEDGREIGYVRFDLAGDEALISTALAPDARGKGYGQAAIRLAASKLRKVHPGRRIVALIRPDNSRSEVAFARAGFVPSGTRPVGGVLAKAMEWVDG